MKIDKFEINVESLIKEIRSKYKIVVCNNRLYFDNEKNVYIQLEHESLEIYFWGFENLYFCFDYNDFSKMLIDIYTFLNHILNNQVKLEEHYKNEKLVKRIIYYNENTINNEKWIRIATEDRIKYFYNRKEQKIITKIYCIENKM